MVDTATADAPWVRVVIVNYNGGALLQSCVDALAAQTMPAFEAVIVDNGSTAPSVGMAKLPDARFHIRHAGANIGFAAANNLGARGSTAPWIATLNPDAFPRPDWLAELRAATERYPWAKAFGSTQLDAQDPAIVDGFGDALGVHGTAWRSGGGAPASALPDQDCLIFSPCAAAALYAKPAFDALGGFDESFFCYMEDVDLGFRLRLCGEQCVQVRRAEVLHVGSAIAGRMSNFGVFYTFRNRMWLVVKDVPWPLLPPVACLQAASTLFSALRPSAGAYRWAALKGAWAGITGLQRAIQCRRAVQRQRIVSSLDVARMLVWNPVGRHSRMPHPVSIAPTVASIAEASGES